MDSTVFCYTQRLKDSGGMHCITTSVLVIVTSASGRFGSISTDVAPVSSAGLGRPTMGPPGPFTLQSGVATGPPGTTPAGLWSPGRAPVGAAPAGTWPQAAWLGLAPTVPARLGATMGALELMKGSRPGTVTVTVTPSLVVVTVDPFNTLEK